MNHLTDDQLNEHLDNSLFDNSALRHLESCDDCRARLEEFKRVFTALDSLPEAPLPRDLSTSILAQLSKESPTRSAPTLRWLSAIQSIGAVAIFVWLASSFTPPPEISNYQLPTIDSIVASVILFLSSISVNLPDSSALLSSSTIEIQTTSLIFLIASAAILWLVGNGLLLRAPLRGARK